MCINTGKGPLHIHKGMKGENIAMMRNEKVNPVSNIFRCLFKDSRAQCGWGKVGDT